MGRTNIGSLDWKKWILRNKKKKEDDSGFSKDWKTILFDGVEQIVWDWWKRKKSESTKCVDFVDVCGNLAIGSKQTIGGVFSI